MLSQVFFVSPNFPLEVPVGHRCASRCVHCEGTCDCDWKNPLKRLIETRRFVSRKWDTLTNGIMENPQNQGICCAFVLICVIEIMD